MKILGTRGTLLSCILTLYLFSSLASVSAATTDCSPGYEYSRRFAACIQSDCDEIEHAHYSYVGYCVCGSSGSMNENPADPNKECARPSDYPSCPRCVYACVHLDEACPGEEPDAATTTILGTTGGGQEYGVFERDGSLYIISPPGETLRISTSDLPPWARNQMVTVGAVIAVVGPPDTVVGGEDGVLLDGLPVARVGDGTAHGGKIVEGSDRIFINGKPAAVIGSFAVDPMVIGNVPAVGGPIIGNCGAGATSQSSETVSCMKENMPSVHTLDEPAEKGGKTLEVDSEGFEVGDQVVIGSSPDHAESGKIAGKGSLILEEPLKNSYPAGTLVTKVPEDREAYKKPIPKPSSNQNTPEVFGGDSDALIWIIGILSVIGVAILIPATIIAVIVVVIIAVWKKRKKKKITMPKA